MGSFASVSTIWIATRLVRLWMATLRWRLESPIPRGPAVFAFWHRNVPAAAAFFRLWRASALVSASRDGQILADLLAGGGLELVRASSSKGAIGGSRRLLASLRAGHCVVTAWDGPRGPAGIPKPGPAWLSRQADTPLFGVEFESKSPLHLKDWSKMAIPLPFSKVTVRFHALPCTPPGGCHA